MRDFDCPLLPVVCLDEENELNKTHPLGGSIVFRRAYLVVGEPALEPSELHDDGGIRHYILLDIGSGEILRGMHHGDRFRRVKDTDTFF